MDGQAMMIVLLGVFGSAAFIIGMFLIVWLSRSRIEDYAKQSYKRRERIRREVERELDEEERGN